MHFFLCRRWIRVAALAALPSLSACSFVDSILTPAPELAAPPPAVETVSPPPVAKPAVASPTRVSRLPLPPPPAPGREAEGRDVEIKVVGLSRLETQALLGPPSGESERSPAKVWQYLTGDCAVDVYFYLDVARNEFYALHYETRGPLASAGASPLNGAAADGCLRRLHDAQRSR
jgi:hypothetical protein